MTSVRMIDGYFIRYITLFEQLGIDQAQEKGRMWNVYFTSWKMGRLCSSYCIFFLQNLSVEQITSKDLTTIFSGPCHGKLRWLQLDVILLLLD